MRKFALNDQEIQKYGDLIKRGKTGILIIRSRQDNLFIHYINKFKGFYNGEAYVFDEFMVSSEYRHLRLITTRSPSDHLHFGDLQKFYFSPKYDDFYIESLPWWCVSVEQGIKILKSWFKKVFQTMDTMIVVDLLSSKSVFLGLMQKSWKIERKCEFINKISRDLVINFWEPGEAEFILKTLRRTKEKFKDTLDIQDYINFIKDCRINWPMVLKSQKLFETPRRILESHLHRKILYSRCTRKKSP